MEQDEDKDDDNNNDRKERMERFLDWLESLFVLACLTCTAMVGHTIHGSIGWAIIDFFFAPIAWIKWLLCHQVNLSIIKATFAFFVQ